MFGWFKKSFEEPVAVSSAVRLLAESLTAPETRDEWVRTEKPHQYVMGFITTYRNEARDLDVSRSWSACGVSVATSVTAPFRLSAADKRVLREALTAFDEHKRHLREKAALARLTAKAIEARSDKTGTGLAVGKSAGRKASPKTSHGNP
jgi:hypothetical protein